MADQTCLVCGKSFTAEQALRWNHEGDWFAFDDLGCRNSFIGKPEKYLKPEKAPS